MAQGTITPQVAACARSGCSNPAAASCGRCGTRFCPDHGRVRGRRYRGLYDICSACGEFSPLRYLLYLVEVAAIVGLGAGVGYLVRGLGGLLLGAIVATVAAIIILWRVVPE